MESEFNINARKYNAMAVTKGHVFVAFRDVRTNAYISGFPHNFKHIGQCTGQSQTQAHHF
jgi:hypothetical protein